jgi:DNA-binding response OmpR family regulator
VGRILLVEDDADLGMTLELTLGAEGHQVTWCRTLKAATEAARGRHDVVVLDLGLPDGDGLRLCQTLREEGSRAPIIVLTARGTLEAKLDGLGAGADDYVTKPFELSELLARIGAQLRRARWQGGDSDRTRVGRLELDFEGLRAWQDGQPVELTELEFRLMEFLMSRRGEAVPREVLLTEVWGLDPGTRTRTVDVFVSRLRRLVETEGEAPTHLKNVRGVGYRLVLDAG